MLLGGSGSTVERGESVQSKDLLAYPMINEGHEGNALATVAKQDVGDSLQGGCGLRKCMKVDLYDGERFEHYRSAVRMAYSTIAMGLLLY